MVQAVIGLFLLTAKLIVASDLPKMEHFGEEHKQRPKQKMNMPYLLVYMISKLDRRTAYVSILHLTLIHFYEYPI